MTSSTISDQVAEFNVGFTAQIGPTLSGVFDQEQADLRAAGIPDAAITVGSVVPDETLLDLDGASTTLSQELDGRSGVLIFYRGAWCPYCNIALRHYQSELLPQLDPATTALIAISPQTQEGSKTIAEGAALEFPVLSDPGNALIRALGIQTIPSAEARAAHTALGFAVADSNADATADVPYPTIVIVDADRTVRFIDVHVDYTTRTEVPVVLEQLASLDLVSAR
jgi:peroxiredoxin